ncbi:MAG: Hemolysin, chromosomal [Microgenomates bacterium OLB22]|nr:MAG: Hemolysin, chromosomal [Microgenomates bacterium OLB22]
MKRLLITIPLRILLSLFVLTFFCKVTASASDISVEFADQPLFSLRDMTPGDTIEKHFTLRNNTSAPQQVFLKLKKKSGLKDLEEVLSMTIKERAVMHKKSSLTDAMTEDGVSIITLKPQATATLTLELLFDQTAGNEYQGGSIIFDVVFGTTTGIPEECQAIPNLSPPIEGTFKSEKLNGTPGNDLIVANAGNDIIDGRGGRDCILGGPGNDIINAGQGDDSILGQEGNDLLKGGDGNDSIYGNEGIDVLHGDKGEDRLFGDLLDILVGGANRDTCSGSAIRIRCEL